MNRLATVSNKIEAVTRPRLITHSTRGRAHGAIVRLVSPSDIGELIKPFVFLDYFEADPARMPTMGFHPHSGIATLTLLISGQTSYEETTGVKGVLPAGGIEWMRAGGGVWHTGGGVGTELIKGYQLWVALPPDLENGPAQSQYLGSAELQSHGPARVILGSHGGVRSKVAAPETMNYLDIRLKAGERWRYEPPQNHSVAWMAVHQGSVKTPASVVKGELAVFEESNGAIEFEAEGDAAFILGSAIKHPHDLVLGYYSVHTTPHALEIGEANIARIGRQLRASGRPDNRVERP
jgi:redox-sensitive bicupin YhaK (pirin superfamily)